ncbi:peptidase inhibitor family I36 protein [Actinokineospora sp. HUAS TT18]|uniref:peptidase inhibitor family I36 protein n=1 Tax=Actinokineospora sp. HUAS TT18 TaxID=3447451 RepID=UPI003F527233
MALKIAKGAVVGVLATAGALAGSGVASASNSTCDVGEYCVYEHWNRTGDRYTTSGSLGNYGTIRMTADPWWEPVGAYLNNNVSSWYNHGFAGRYSVIHSYDGANGAGGQLWSGGVGQGQAWVGSNNDRAGGHLWRNS